MNTIKNNRLLYIFTAILSIQLMSLESCGKTAQLNNNIPITPPIVGAWSQGKPTPQKQDDAGNQQALSPEEVAKKKAELEKQPSQADDNNSSIDMTDQEIEKASKVMHAKLTGYYTLPGKTKPEKLKKDLTQAQEDLKKYQSKLEDLKKDYKPYKVNFWLTQRIIWCQNDIVNQKCTIQFINNISTKKINQLQQYEILN